jgi:vacuolar protein-sorting-associated protein 4
MSNTDFLGRAIETVKKAVEYDNDNNYKEAYTAYMNSCERKLVKCYGELN